jgi:hypothetical protein
MISRLSVPDGMGMAQVMPRGGRMGFCCGTTLNYRNFRMGAGA